MVEDAEELLGMKNLFFKVFIRSASGLPKALNCNPFVTYQFRFDKDAVYSTPEMVGIASNPQFNFEQVHKIEEITPDVVKELKEGSISFMVYGYPPARNKLSQDQVKPDTTAENAFQRRRTMLSKEPVIDANDEAKVLGLESH